MMVNDGEYKEVEYHPYTYIIYIYIYIYIWVNYNDLTSRPNPGIMVSKGKYPQMAELFRLVKYDNLPR